MKHYIPGFLAMALILGSTSCGQTGAIPPGEFPDRPFVLDVAQLDPCAALTDQQENEFALLPGRPGRSQDGTSRGCTWIGSSGLGWNLQTLADDAAGAIGAEPTSTVVNIAGFGAVQSSPPAQGTGLPFCQAVVDVADGAALRSQVQVVPDAPGVEQPTVEDACQELRQVTTLMLDNLHAQQTS